MTSKVYMLPETAIPFNSASTPSFTPTSLATVSGHQSGQYDFGTSARAYIFNWRAYVQFATAPVVGETIDIYIKTSDGTHIDNDDGTTDAAVSSIDKLKNLTYIGSITVDETTADLEMSTSGTVELTHRYFQVVFWNATVDSLTATATEHGFILEPIAAQGQAT